MSPDLDRYLVSLRHFLDAHVALKAARSELQRYLDESTRIGKRVFFTGLDRAAEDASHAPDTILMDAECWPSAERLQALCDAASVSESGARSAYSRMTPAEREMVSYPFQGLSLQH